MVFVLFALTGMVAGYRLDMTRARYIVMALTIVVFSAGCSWTERD